jgi:hypothetical protein
MFETTGSLAILQPVLALVALVVLPLVWAVAAAFSARPRRGPPGVAGPTIAITCAVGTVALAVVLVVRLALLSRGHVLVQHIAQLARLGQLDLSFALAVDPRNATFALLIALIGCASALHTSWSARVRRRRADAGDGRPPADPAATLAWTGLATAGAMLACVGDGFAPLLVGLGLLSIGAWGLASGSDATADTTALAGNVSVLLGFVFLFWSLGGSFGPAGYDPDGAPRFVLVTTPARVDAPKAALSMTTHAGALVSSDDAHLPGEPIVSPFNVLVEPGVYTLRVQGGPASGEIVVPRVALAAGRTHVLAPYGPTTSLRVLDDQVAVPRLTSPGVTVSVRALLAARTIGGLRASAIVLLLVVGGALAHAHALASRRRVAAPAAILEAVPAAYLALRLAFLADPASADGALVAVLGGGSSLLLGAKAACLEDADRALRCTSAAAASVAVVAVGVGEPAAALVLSSTGLIATAAALTAVETRRAVRWMGVACAAAVGVLPFVGTSAGYIHAVAAALASAAMGTVGWAVFSALVAGAIVVTAALTALASFRVYDSVVRVAAREPGTSRGRAAVVVTLAGTSLVVGAALGVGTSLFGGSIVPLACRVVGSTPVATPLPAAIAAVGLSWTAAGGGLVLARRVCASSQAPAWLLALGRPYAVLGWAVVTIGRGARFLQRSVRAMDRDVVDDVPLAFRDLALRVAGLFRRRERAGGAVAAGLEMDEPRSLERVVAVSSFVMTVLLAAVLISSFLLR